MCETFMIFAHCSKIRFKKQDTNLDLREFRQFFVSNRFSGNNFIMKKFRDGSSTTLSVLKTMLVIKRELLKSNTTSHQICPNHAFFIFRYSLSQQVRIRSG